jgi:Mn2+/Fe2+ NRAMP family transporter
MVICIANHQSDAGAAKILAKSGRFCGVSFPQWKSATEAHAAGRARCCVVNNEGPPAPLKRHARMQWFGPGLIMAVSGIGASDIISATVGGATYGTTLLWALVLGAFFKFVLTEGLARWQLATGTTLLQGWARYLPRWVLLLFCAYLVLWSIAVSAALISGCGLALVNISAGRVSFVAAALGHALAAFLLLRFAGTEFLGRIIKPLIAVMFVSVVGCAALSFRDLGALLSGLFVPSLPKGGSAYVFSLIGGIGGSLTLLNYNYLLRDQHRVDPASLRHIRFDLALAYVFTAVFGLSVMLIASRVFQAAGIRITDNEAVSRMAGQLAEVTGPAGFYVYSIGFWAAVLASLLGVWQTVPHIFVDCWDLLRRNSPVPPGATTERRPAYVVALTFMALAAVPFAFVRRPLFLVVAFTILGSLFVPFLAATLLQLNNRVPWPAAIRHNRPMTNVVLAFVLLVFLIVGAIEVLSVV